MIGMGMGDVDRGQALAGAYADARALQKEALQPRAETQSCFRRGIAAVNTGDTKPSIELA
jgi:hypothetical protein